MGRIGFGEIVVILVIVVLVFGAKRIPEIASAIGRALKEFRKASREAGDELNSTLKNSGDDKK